MATWKKIRDRLLNNANDITFDEIVTLLRHYGFQLSNKGKTSGSRAMFHRGGKALIYIHKPHPEKELNEACLSDIREVILLLDEDEREETENEEHD